MARDIIRRRRLHSTFGFVTGLLVLLLATIARADDPAVLENLLHTIVSESTPSAFSVNDFDTTDFALEWEGKPLPGVTLRLAPGSLQWVRVGEVLVLPRGRAIIEVANRDPESRSGHVTYAGFTSPLVFAADQGRAEFSVALLSGAENRIELTLKGGEKGVFRPHFRPRPELKGPFVYYDTSCSRFSVRAKTTPESTARSSWAYFGCRIVHEKSGVYNTTALELYTFWDNVGSLLKMNGSPVSSSAPEVWALKVRPRQALALEAQGQTLDVSYSIPEVENRGFIGLGLGPYSYTIEGGALGTNRVVPLATLYASYFISDNARLVAFDATAIHREFFSDLGLYLNTQSIKTLDNRLIGNVMLGAHVLGFRSSGQNYVRFSAPQGIELIYRDFLKPAHNLILGAFLYPPINNRSYYNVWLRWGSPKFFGEINYISWRERIGAFDEIALYSRSFGLSFGIPLFRFL